jgi:hypothetical protein
MKILAYITAIFFVLTSSLALVFFNVDAIALQQETYEKIFEQKNLYTELPSLLAKAARESEATAKYDGIPSDIIETLFTSSYSSDDIKAIITDALGQFFDYINYKSDGISISLSLQPLKTQLTTPEFSGEILTFLATQPKCTSEQRDQLLESGFIAGDRIILCNQPGPFTNEKGTLNFRYYFVEEQLAKISESEITSQISLVEIKPGTTDFRDQLKQGRNLIKFIYIGSAIFLLLTSILAIRSLRDWLKWWGWPILCIAIISLIISVILPSQALQNFSALLVDIPAQLTPVITGLGEDLLALIFNSLKTQALILGVAGLIMILAEYFLAKRSIS